MDHLDVAGSTMNSGSSMPTIYYDGVQSLSQVLSAVGLPNPRPVLIIAGWAGGQPDSLEADAQRLLLERAVASICVDTDVVTISGGTDAGIMSALGRVLAEYSPQTHLVGVAPHKKLIGYGASDNDPEAARPDPSHILIRTAGDSWGSEGPSLVRLAERIASGRPIVMLAIGGGQGARGEISLACRRGWPVLLITGAGGASQDVVDLVQTGVETAGRRASPSVPAAEHDQIVLQASGEGGLAWLSMTQFGLVQRFLRWNLSGDSVLREAWTRFAQADAAASSRKPETLRRARIVLGLAIGTVIVAGALAISAQPPAFARWVGHDGAETGVRLLVTVLPLSAAVLLAMLDRRARSGTWIELRAAAESLLREIYRCRAGVGVYRDDVTRGHLLSDALSQIDARLEGRIAVPAGLAAGTTWPPGELNAHIDMTDTLLGGLAPSEYDKVRVENQLRFMNDRINATEREAARISAFLFVVSAITATFLAVSWKWNDAASGAAVFASFAAALISWREYRQLDATTDAHRQTVVELRGARARWQAMDPDERESPAALSVYAGEVEDALASEGSQWERSLRQAHQGFISRQRGS